MKVTLEFTDVEGEKTSFWKPGQFTADLLGYRIWIDGVDIGFTRSYNVTVKKGHVIGNDHYAALLDHGNLDAYGHPDIETLATPATFKGAVKAILIAYGVNVEALTENYLKTFDLLTHDVTLPLPYGDTDRITKTFI